MALSDARIKAEKAGDRQRKLFDGDGLFLLVHSNGSKYWRLKFRLHGKERVLALGVYPAVKLKQARAARDEARSLIAEGKDPVVTKHETKREQIERAANSFEAVARAWCKRKVSDAKRRRKWSSDHGDRVLDSLTRDVFPYIGRRPIAEITTPEILRLLDRVIARGAYDVAGRIKQRCSSVFRYAIATHKATYNPAAQIDPEAIEAPEVQHRKWIKRDELPAFLERLEGYDGHPLTILALRLVLLTFVRSGELRGARWDEFDMDRAEWRVPAARMKGGRQGHIVPLSRQALEVLAEIKKHSWHDDLLFPATTGGGKVMSENTLLYALYRMGYHGRATVHGFRSTASTILNEIGFKPDVIERQLAHVEGNKVRAAYNHAQYLPERIQMMQSWADYLDAAARGRKVLPIRKAAG
ncbi:MAG: tyrosine-type recombinase/integrase [Betaproteobacteria bacterium]|nr:tyrosine-type recombinase/integrase [Betaproteobacteria bacterium]